MLMMTHLKTGLKKLVAVKLRLSVERIGTRSTGHYVSTVYWAIDIFTHIECCFQILPGCPGGLGVL